MLFSFRLSSGLGALRRRILSVFGFYRLRGRLGPIAIRSLSPPDFGVSSTCFYALAFLIEFFSEFSQLLTPVTFGSLFPTFSVGRQVFSSALSCSPNSRREPPYMSSVERQASSPSSEAPGVNFRTTVVPCTFRKRLAPLVPFTFARR